MSANTPKRGKDTTMKPQYGDRRIIAEWIESIPEMKDLPGELDWDKAVWVEQESRSVEAANELSLNSGVTGEGRVRVQEYMENNTYRGGDWDDVELWIDGELARTYSNDDW